MADSGSELERTRFERDVTQDGAERCGRFGYRDQGETANTQISVMDFGDTQLIFEVRGLKTKDFHGQTVGNIAHLEEGIIVSDKYSKRGGLNFYPKGKTEGIPLAKVVTIETDAGRAKATSRTSSRRCGAGRSRT